MEHRPGERRPVDVVVISDVHLGTPACRAEELLAYLKSVQPGKLVLNGDILDLAQFHRRHWPDLHTRVVRRILKFAATGTPVFYVTGNHELFLRRYSTTGFDLGRINLCDRLDWTVGGQRTLIVHGDCCDEELGIDGWIERMGSWAYDRIESVGNWLNRGRRMVGGSPVSLTRALKHRIPRAVEHIARFEDACAELAVAGGYEAIVCGHIHHPACRSISVGDQRPLYLNSGDWVENCTALEFAHDRWALVRYDEMAESGDLMPGFIEETRAVG